MAVLDPEMLRLCHSDSTQLSPVRDTLDRISNKWSLLILGMLEDGPLRFTALQKLVPGISQRMLTHTLRSLQRDGLVSREAFAEIPPRVEYAVTDLGRTLLPVIVQFAQWAYENRDLLEANHEQYDLAHDG
jgi:DNA-binding HxlR family transcriptional regulator